MSVKALNPDEAKRLADQLHLEHPDGVVVDDVRPGSLADDLELQRFDVILSINRTDVRSVNDFNRLQSQLKPGQDVLLWIARRNGRGYTTYYLADRLP